MSFRSTLLEARLEFFDELCTQFLGNFNIFVPCGALFHGRLKMQEMWNEG